MCKRSDKRFQELLPWYVAGSLADGERAEVERWLQRSPEARDQAAEWRGLRAAVRSQAQQRPSAAVWQHVLARARQSMPQRRALSLPRLVWGGALAVVLAILLWAIVRPGIVLQWSVDDGSMTAFRVYRAPAGSTDFGLVYETPAHPDAQRYTYVDGFFVPGRTYVYRVEGVRAGNRPAVSQVIAANGVEAMPGQLAILLAGLIGGFGAMALVQQLRNEGRCHVRVTRLLV